MDPSGKQLSVSLPSDTRLLHALTNLARSSARIAGFDEGEAAQISLAVTEALTNVMEHAYAGIDGRPIEVQFKLLDDGIEVRIIHEGVPVDPGVLEASERSAGRLEVRTGGYGVLMMRRLMDRVQYRDRDDRRHECCLSKFRQSVSGEQSGASGA